MSSTALSETSIHDIHSALVNNHLVTIERNSATAEEKIVRQSFFSWLIHLPFKSYYNERMARLAEALSKTLQDTPRAATLEAAWRNNTVQTTRLLLRKISPVLEADPRIIECRKQILAFKLNIPGSALDVPANEGFASYATSPPLERYLMEYGHRVEVDATTQEISILSGGTYQKWSQVKDSLKAVEKRPKPSQPWTYGPEGVQQKDMYEWTELKPFKKGDPAEWNHQYVFEFCVCCFDSPHKTGDHSWLRLKTPEGDIYSVGLYRPGKVGRSDNWKLPFRVKKGHLMQPELSEFWPMPIHSIPVAISKEQFLEMKRTIEEDKRRDDLVFQLGANNCSLYVAKIAKIGNIDLPTKRSVLRILTPRNLEPVVDAIAGKLPRVVYKVVHVVGAFFLNLLLFILGASVVDKTVKINVKPHITSLWDLFDTAKTDFHHPHTVGHHTRRLVEQWRQKRLAELHEELDVNPDKTTALQAQIAKVPFDIPPQFRVAAATSL